MWEMPRSLCGITMSKERDWLELEEIIRKWQNADLSDYKAICLVESIVSRCPKCHGHMKDGKCTVCHYEEHTVLSHSEARDMTHAG